MGGGTAVLVQTHGAERPDGETNLLTKTHQQPVDLTPKLPMAEWERNTTTMNRHRLMCLLHTSGMCRMHLQVSLSDSGLYRCVGLC